MKKTLALILVLLMLAALSACAKDPAAPSESGPAISEEDKTETPVSGATEATEATAPTEPEPETVSRPTADGQAVEAYDISFYLPEDMTANEWNGMLGVYDFYTGENLTGTPTGMDITLSATAESNADGDLNAYARKMSADKTGVTAEPAAETFNGTEWLVFREDGKVNYFAIFNNGLYEIYAARGGETEENFKAALAMLEATLFLAVNPD